MNDRRLWVCVSFFALTTINDTGRVALSLAASRSFRRWSDTICTNFA